MTLDKRRQRRRLLQHAVPIEVLQPEEVSEEHLDALVAAKAFRALGPRCLALPGPAWPCLDLPGPAWPCLALPCLTLRCIMRMHHAHASCIMHAHMPLRMRMCLRVRLLLHLCLCHGGAPVAEPPKHQPPLQERRRFGRLGTCAADAKLRYRSPFAGVRERLHATGYHLAKLQYRSPLLV